MELEASVLSSHLCCRVLSPVSSSQFCLHSPILSPRLSPVSSVFYVTSLCQLSRSDHHHLRPPSPATTIFFFHSELPLHNFSPSLYLQLDFALFPSSTLLTSNADILLYPLRSLTTITRHGRKSDYSRRNHLPAPSCP